MNNGAPPPLTFGANLDSFAPLLFFTLPDRTQVHSMKRIRKAVLRRRPRHRFLPATKAVPKEMMNVVDRPVVQHVVDEAKAAGIEHFVL